MREALPGKMSSGPAPVGRLPDFLVIGAPRSGTTSLAQYLKAHDQVHMSSTKEVRFFSHPPRWERGTNWYMKHFTGARADQKTGEASPQYLATLDAHPRMAEVVPDARLISILRNPVDRAWSHYWFRKMWRAEPGSFESAVDDEITGRGRPAGGEYLAFGRYADQIKHLQRYYSQEKHLVLLFDDLVADPVDLFRRICRHLGVSDDAIPSIVGEQINTTRDVRSYRLALALSAWRKRRGVIGKVARRMAPLNTVAFNQPPMPGQIRNRLIDTFAHSNAELASLIGRDLSRWSS